MLKPPADGFLGAARYREAVQPSPEQLTLSDYLAPLRARRWLIVAIVVVATAGTYAYSSQQPEVYEASTKLYLNQNPEAGYSDDRTVENQATLLRSQDVARRVAEEAGYRGSPASLASRMRATRESEADFITITVQGDSAEEAARLANAYAKVFIDVRSDDIRGQIERQRQDLREQLERVPQGPRAASEREQIEANLRQVEVALRSAQGNATQVDPAAEPGSPVSPTPRRDALAAFGLSLFGAMLLAYLLHRLDPRLRRVEDAAAIYDRPIMASVFHDDEIDAFKEGRPVMSEKSIETFRQLRINLDLAALDQPFRMIVVTSAGAGEGKSTVARNLALAYHEAGRRVAVVDADLRNPRQPGRLGVKVDAGLTDVLSGERSLEETVLGIEVPSRGRAALDRMTAAGVSDNGAGPSQLTLLAAGSQPPNPPAILESDATAAVLDTLRGAHDVVIVDTPPLLAVSDAIPLLSRADGVLLVARSGITDRRGATRTAELISRVPGVNLIGVVVNDLSGAEADAYGYGYGYGYRYGARSDGEASPVGSGRS